MCVKKIIAWDCSDSNKRSLALDNGVTSIPAYIVSNGVKTKVLTKEETLCGLETELVGFL